MTTTPGGTVSDTPKAAKSSTTLYHVFIVDNVVEPGEGYETLTLKSRKRDVPAYNPKRACELVVEGGEPEGVYVALPMSSVRAHAVKSTTTIHTKAEEIAL